MTNLFTADGASGRAITELSCETLIKAGRALALILSNRTGRRAKILIGRDTRISSEIFTAALSAGCCSAGADCHILGVIPTPAVSCLCEKYSADAGIMVTAAHNSFEYNGIKLFGEHGYALESSVLQEMERLVGSKNTEAQCRGGEDIGRIIYEKNAEWDYVRSLFKKIDADLARMRVVVDCANGAACSCAEKFFRGLGATVTLINCEPDGKNINSGCGAFSPEALASAVQGSRAHAGIALDGDGGRCVMTDEKGNILRGDSITAILAYYMKREGRLPANGCAASQTMNLAFFNWAKENGILISQAHDVGLSYLIERMKEQNFDLAGSESGQIVIRSFAADGMLAGACVLGVMAATGKKLSELASIYTPYESFTVNVPLRAEYCGRWADVPALKEMIEYCQQKLEGTGRVLVRESSTSPILRIIAEGRDRDTVWQYVQAISKTARDYVGTEDEDENG